MSGDVHVRICEHLGGRFPGVTRLVILASSRYALRKAIRKVHEVLSSLMLALHPVKRFIGRTVV